MMPIWRCSDSMLLLLNNNRVNSDADAEFRRAHSLKGGTGSKSVLPLSPVCQTRVKKKHRQIKRLERSLVQVQIYKKEVILILVQVYQKDRLILSCGILTLFVVTNVASLSLFVDGRCLHGDIGGCESKMKTPGSGFEYEYEYEYDER
eukprot:scaffold11907_cov93-Skeletonema_dohrnii-CCMP3373.AAC.2